MWDASISNHRRYLNATTGLFDDRFVETTTCPVCNESKSTLLFQKSGGRYVECTECSMVYLNPSLKQEFLTQYYRENHGEQANTVESDLSFYNTLYNQGLNSILSLESGNKILDIGCSSGVFLDQARNRGLETFGIELNNRERMICEKKGHKVFDKMIQEMDFDQTTTTFDIVTMWDVYEHVKSPKETLLTIRDKLSPNGVFFVQVPSSDSLAARVLQEKCNMFDGLEHINLFGAKQLELIGRACGFRLAKIESVIPETKVLNRYLSFQDPYLSDKNPDYLSRLELSDSFVLQNLLGYKLQATFQKHN